MPELPEVETTRRGIATHVVNHTVTDVIVRNRHLRWPIPPTLGKHIKHKIIRAVERRAKYLLFRFDNGTLILHLGMSGSLRVVPSSTAAEKHDHVDFILDTHQCLRFKDPRRFGSILWFKGPAEQHKLLRELGPEPLSEEFNTDYLVEQASNRKVAIKNLIMNSHVVVGVGNIYANEALYLAGIHPRRAAGRISVSRIEKLVTAIKTVLQTAIAAGGTTLRDFTQSNGKPGYFRQKLNVYDRTGEACPRCRRSIKHTSIGQRSSYYCPHCQR